MQFSSPTSISPSFTGNSSNNLADIAARVVEEFHNQNRHNNDDDDDIYGFTEIDGNCTEHLTQNEEDIDEDDEFEFAVVCRNPNSSSVSADEMFSNGEIVQRYPLFDRSLLEDDKPYANSTPEKVVRNPLGKLFREERWESASCSSSEADNLDGVAPETYCIWKPKVESPEICTKSNSTGNSSKRWRFRNLLRRSNSDIHITAGKDVDFRPLTALTATKIKKVDKTAKVAGADDDGEPTMPVKYQINRSQSFFRYKKDRA